MKLQVSTINEFPFYPDVSGNLELEEKERFTVILKRVNPATEGASWFKDDTFTTWDNSARLRSYIKRIENPPLLQIDGGKDERALTVDDLLNDVFPELFPIVAQLNNHINKVEETGKLETKKS